MIRKSINQDGPIKPKWGPAPDAVLVLPTGKTTIKLKIMEKLPPSISIFKTLIMVV